MRLSARLLPLVTAALLVLGSSPAVAGDGRALILDGVDDVAVASHSAALDMSAPEGTARTLDVIFYVVPPSLPVVQSVLNKEKAYELAIDYRPGTESWITFSLWKFNPLSTNPTQVTAPAIIGQGLHHLAVTVVHSSTTGLSASLFLDGHRIGTAFPSSVYDSEEAEGSLVVGAGSEAPFLASVDEIRISNFARYTDEFYSIPVSPLTADGDTTALWHFDDSADSFQFADASGLGNSLIPVNGAAAGIMPEDIAAGTLDRSFNPGAGAGATIYPRGIYALAVQPNGSLIIGGQFDSYNNIPRTCLARISRDGVLDTAFNPVIAASSGTPQVKALGLLPDGDILIGGIFTQVNGVARKNLARLNADGTLDAAFNPAFSYMADVTCLSVLPGGASFLLGGTFIAGTSPNSRDDLARFTAAGAVDMSFNAGDIFGSVRRMGLQPDGKILLGGTFSKIATIPRDGFARLNANGSLDAFAPAFSLGSSQSPDSFAIQPDGKIAIAGRFTSVNGQPRAGAARLHSDGTLDPSFVIGSGPDNVFSRGGSLHWVAVQPDGKLLFSGFFLQSSTGEQRLGRFLPDGSVDATFKSVHYLQPNTRVSSHVLYPDGQLLIAGEFSDISGISRRHIARLLGDSPLPRFTSVTLQSDGRVRLELSGLRGRTYDLQSATAGLNNWQLLRSDVMPLAGTLEWFITPAPGVKSAFFRAKLQP